MIINTEELKTPLEINEEKYQRIAETVLKDYYEDMPEFSLTFVEPERILELNRTYRGINSVTDVLSFESDGEIDPETNIEYLGDIVICADQAQKQAEQSGHLLEDEIALLEIHGLLHLLGYDHGDEEEKTEMWKYQDMYLDQCGIKLNRRPGEDFDF